MNWFGVSAAKVDISDFKYMCCNWNLQLQIDISSKKYTLKSVF